MNARRDEEQELLWDTVEDLIRYDKLKAQAVLKAAIERLFMQLNMNTSFVSELQLSIQNGESIQEVRRLDSEIRKITVEYISESSYEMILNYIEKISEMTENPQVIYKKMLASIWINEANQPHYIMERKPVYLHEREEDGEDIIAGENVKKFYTTSEAANKLGLSDQTIRRMCEKGTFKKVYRSEGGHWRIHEDNFVTTKEQDDKANSILEHLDKKNQRAEDVDEFNL
ncbi:helix-turn-helix domain-containing protein [Oceanobacillus timonensis]|uniref:helix-turn-helix domain-containing protein n=1 Tax=Oceanobacillus timonensis TaxID=1926285 RepID=UPI0009BC0DBB|nr:helix-turn-helix domain-containing protein [Oceanobacillus timonensis]